MLNHWTISCFYFPEFSYMSSCCTLDFFFLRWYPVFPHLSFLCFCCTNTNLLAHKQHQPERLWHDCATRRQAASLRQLEEENHEAAARLKEVVTRGDMLLEKIQSALADIAQSQLRTRNGAPSQTSPAESWPAQNGLVSNITDFIYNAQLRASNPMLEQSVGLKKKKKKPYLITSHQVD